MGRVGCIRLYENKMSILIPCYYRLSVKIVNIIKLYFERFSCKNVIINTDISVTFAVQMNNYEKRAKSRKLKKTMTQGLQLFKFRSLQITNGEKVIVFWTTLVLLSLFIPWVSSLEWQIQVNSFSNLTWRTGIMLLIICFLLLWMIFSKQKKEKIKMIWNLHFRNYLLWIVGWLFIFISALSSLSYIWWLQTFSSDIIYGQWPVISLVGWIIVFFWAFMLKKEENSGIENIFTEEKNENKNKINKKQKDNMKLPF